MVGDGDQRALPVTGVDASCGVSDDESLAAEETEDAGGEGDLGEGVALISMNAALHDGYGDLGDGAEDEVSGVALDGGAGEVGDLGVGDAEGGLDLGGEASETGAEDDADGGPNGSCGADIVDSGLGVAVEIGHFRFFRSFFPGGVPPIARR